MRCLWNFPSSWCILNLNQVHSSSLSSSFKRHISTVVILQGRSVGVCLHCKEPPMNSQLQEPLRGLTLSLLQGRNLDQSQKQTGWDLFGLAKPEYNWGISLTGTTSFIHSTRHPNQKCSNCLYLCTQIHLAALDHNNKRSCMGKSLNCTHRSVGNHVIFEYYTNSTPFMFNSR